MHCPGHLGDISYGLRSDMKRADRSGKAAVQVFVLVGWRSAHDKCACLAGERRFSMFSGSVAWLATRPVLRIFLDASSFSAEQIANIFHDAVIHKASVGASSASAVQNGLASQADIRLLRDSQEHIRGRAPSSNFPPRLLDRRCNKTGKGAYWAQRFAMCHRWRAWAPLLSRKPEDRFLSTSLERRILLAIVPAPQNSAPETRSGSPCSSPRYTEIGGRWNEAESETWCTFEPNEPRRHCEPQLLPPGRNGGGRLWL